jgi:segregation and condensation protein B
MSADATFEFARITLVCESVNMATNDSESEVPDGERPGDQDQEHGNAADDLSDALLSDDAAEFSIEELSKAYAKIIAEQQGIHHPSGESDDSPGDEDHELADLDDSRDNAGAAIDEHSIVEAILFVGVPDGEKLTARKLAASMRDVSPREIKKIVSTLNERYEADGNPYRIVLQDGGYAMRLTDEFAEIRESFYGEIREVELNRNAIELLSVVAYRQPVTRAEIDQVRQKPSGSLLRQLVERNLIVETIDEQNRKNRTYTTGPRFLELLGLESIEDLPMAHEVDDIDEFFGDSIQG